MSLSSPKKKKNLDYSGAQGPELWRERGEGGGGGVGLASLQIFFFP